MNNYMVWVTKITHAQVAVEISAENEQKAMDEAVNLAATREDFSEVHEVKYEVNYVNKFD